MTLIALKQKKAELVAAMNNAKTAKMADGISDSVRKAIIASNVKRYRNQITALQRQIDRIEGRDNKTPKGLGNTVLPASFQLA